MGQSAGRSRGNRDGQGAVRRATPRERNLVDPPFPVEPKSSLERLTELAGPTAMDAVALAIWIFFCVLLSVVVCAWWGLL